ncbi:hypothetical protein Ddye_019918 [Dipteronia dyeriana]|uniref:MULE transposase domain-containing protein n=1 Tax=Dipteronia dyeriana TaxID=168575 RepID=A0AAD9TZM3_9ROSI|nr:hypothetical protein Ddye_019918 [Dipteronia dyeriana]
MPSDGFTSVEKGYRTLSPTNKHLENAVDDSEFFETSATEDEDEDEDECSSDRKMLTYCKEAETDGAPNSSTPSSTTRWTIPRKFVDLGRHIRPKDIMTDQRDKLGINLSYNKAYRYKYRTLHNIFNDPWESFKMFSAYFHMLQKLNLGMITKIETDRKNRFKYGFMALVACIEGFNTVIRQVIAVDTTHLKSNTRGILLVVVCKYGNEMIYALAFLFANYECSKSWT